MRKISNIRLKDEPNAGIMAMKRFKDSFGCGLAEAKGKIDELLTKGEITCEYTHHNDCHRVYDILFIDYHSLEYYFKDIFDFDFTNDDPDPYAPIPRIADEATIEALNWFAGLSGSDQARVELIGKWKNPQMGGPCG